MAKRAHERAFSLDIPGRPQATASNGFGAPQPPIRSPDTSSRVLHIPGHWPLEQDFLSDPFYDAAPTAAPGSPARGSFLSIVHNWPVAVALKGILAIPARLAQFVFRSQRLLVQPVIRKDGARKKRIIDAGLVDEPGTPTPARRGAVPRRIGRGRSGARARMETTSDLWSPSPSPATPPVIGAEIAAGQEDSTAPVTTSNFIGIWSPTPSPSPSSIPIAQTVEGTEFVVPTAKDTQDEDEDVEMDDSIDFSWSDVIASDTPPSVRVFDISSSTECNSVEVLAQTPPSPATNLVAKPRAYAKDLPKLKEYSPNTHRRILAEAPVTPLRKAVLHRQLGNYSLSSFSAPRPANHTVAAPEPLVKGTTELRRKVVQASVLKINAPAITQSAQLASEQQRAEAEARQNHSSDAPLVSETVNEELSFLSDAPDVDGADTTIYSPQPLVPQKRVLRWSTHANAKAFYVDEKVADMLDSTLETILSSPAKRPVPDGVEYEDSDSDSASTASVGFTGVPASTWDDSDDSLEESQMSLELLGDLQQDLQSKLQLEPTPPPPPPVKALVTPLSSEEQDILADVATKTDNGRDVDASVVGEKLNARDFSTLLPDQFNGDPRAWLNDNIVNEYLTILTARVKKQAGFEHKRGGTAPPVHAFSSFWYPTLKNRPKSVERWAARFQLAGKQYLDAELLLYPICDAGHWRLLVVKPKKRKIEYLDSLGWNATKYIDALQEYLAKELGDAYIADEWLVEERQRSTRQVNGSDCGVFAVLNALALLRGEEFTKVLACDGMLDARERIAVTLLAGEPTTELD